MKIPLSSLRRSLTTRLLLLFLLASILLVALLIATLAHGFGSQWKSTIKPHLEQYLDFVNEEIGYPPSEERAVELADRLPVNIYIHGPEKKFSTTGSPLDLTDLEFRSRYKHRRPMNHNIDFGEHHDRTVLRNRVGDYSLYYEIPHSRNRTQHYNGIKIALLVLAGILAGCYWILRRMLRPVQDIQQGVKRMGAGALETRVPVRADNDLGTLATSINTMASDIEQMLDAKRQLLLGASHELRSPITRAKIATQLLPPSENRDRIEDDLTEMESLIAELLESERMKGGHSVLNRQSVNLPALVHSVLDELQNPVVDLSVESGILSINIDETRIRLLLRNLIKNALTHGANPDALPSISLTQTQTAIRFMITDFGPGISESDLKRITEPFYRADPSRTRATGGFGLGLHLSELIAAAHNGTLSINSKHGAGTTVTLELPLQ